MAKKPEITEIKTMYERSCNTGHFAGEKFYYQLPHAIKTEEVVDMDNFIPINEALKKLDGKRELTGDEVKTYYDFSSGTDNHAEIPFNRSAKNLDLAMLSEHIQTTQNEIKKEISEKQEEMQWRQEIASKNAQNSSTSD